jgi:hypothetical protein
VQNWSMEQLLTTPVVAEEFIKFAKKRLCIGEHGHSIEQNALDHARALKGGFCGIGGGKQSR